jgi:hypothetical protein
MVDLGLLGSSPSSHGTQRVCPTGEGERPSFMVLLALGNSQDRALFPPW